MAATLPQIKVSYSRVSLGRLLKSLYARRKQVSRLPIDTGGMERRRKILCWIPGSLYESARHACLTRSKIRKGDILQASDLRPSDEQP